MFVHIHTISSPKPVIQPHEFFVKSNLYRSRGLMMTTSLELGKVATDL